MSRISIASPQEIVAIDRGRMREVVRAVLDGENEAEAEISLAFVDNPTIHPLNKRYLQHDEPTDVLSFPLSEPGAAKLSGELVIGVEVALAQAPGARPRRAQRNWRCTSFTACCTCAATTITPRPTPGACANANAITCGLLGLPDIAPRDEE